MLNFLQISLTSRCNLSCWHCPMANDRNTDNPEYVLTNERLVPWLKNYISPFSWLIELTGGEPALYNGIDELCEWLSVHGYHVLVKTNGLLPIQPRKNVIRVAAFHQLDNPPKYFDKILIVDKIQREEKELVCQKNNWIYEVIGYNDDVIDNVRHKFDKIAYIDPHGHPVACKDRPIRYTEWPDKYALEFAELKTTKCCPTCKAGTDAWRFMPDNWKKM